MKKIYDIWMKTIGFRGSLHYWRVRYAREGNSGVGSFDIWAEFKSKTLNEFVRNKRIASVLDFGCGDGNQASLFDFPSYLGFDSEEAVSRGKILLIDERKKLLPLREYRGERADLSLSLDVIYHLVEDEVFEKYMNQLFDASTHYVVIYSTNINARLLMKRHLRHRVFTDWIGRNRPDFGLVRIIPNIHPGILKHTPQFYVYSRFRPEGETS